MSKRMTQTVVITIVILILLGSVWIWSASTDDYPRTTHISFPYIRAEDIEPEIITKDIMEAIGYPDIVPIVTKDDWFRVVLYNFPKQNDIDMKLHSLSSSLTVRVPDKDQVMTYELNLSQSGELEITYRNEIYEGLPYGNTHPISGFSFNELLSAIRDFPAESYRERTEYGDEHADLYEITLNSGGSLLGESFVYNKNGHVQVDGDGKEYAIPFLIVHNNWGKVRDDSLNQDDPQRYFSFGGKGRTNAYYYPDGYNEKS